MSRPADATLACPPRRRTLAASALLPLACLLLLALAPLQAQTLDLRLAGATARHSGAAARARMLKLSQGLGALALTASFHNDSARRACWDLTVNEDLTHCAGIRLRLLCKRPEIVQQFNLYLKTGNAWQAVSFTPIAAEAWHDIFIPKAHFLPEGQPQSWKNVSTLRLALWKGAVGQTSIAISQIEFVRPNGRLAIVRSGHDGHDMRRAHRYAQSLADALLLAGIRPAVLEETDTTYLNLRPYAFVFMPAPAEASPEQCDAIASFIRRGGKAAVFHSLPPIIQQAMAMPAGRFMQTATANIAFSGVQMQRYALPSARNFLQPSTAFIAIQRVMLPLKTLAWWQDTAGQPTQYPAIIESPHGFWMTHAYLGKDNPNAAATFSAMACKFLPALAEAAARTAFAQASQALLDTPADHIAKKPAQRALDAARNSFANRQFDTCIQLTRNCLDELAACGIRPVPAARDELRAVWCQYPDGLPGLGWNATAQLLANANANALFAYAASPLTAAFPSRIAPLVTSQTALRDCAQACRANGIQLFAALNCLSLANEAASPATAAAVRTWENEGRLQVNAQGHTLPWLCPSQLRNRHLLARLAAEMAGTYRLDGLCLDFIRFPSADACCCPSCRQAFAMYTGGSCNWPDDILPGAPLHKRWLLFRQRLISSLAQEIAGAARQAYPSVKVAAAVYADLESARFTVGQNWSAWLASGTISLACPMAYQLTDTAFTAAVQRQQQLLGPRLAPRLLPAIGLSTHNLSATDAQRQLFAARKLRTAGVLLFKLDTREARDIIPHLFQNP